MRKLSSFAAGLLFGLGLLLSGMANPAKVIGFLDLFGAWDPSLALVMAGLALSAGFSVVRQARRELKSHSATQGSSVSTDTKAG